MPLAVALMVLSTACRNDRAAGLHDAASLMPDTLIPSAQPKLTEIQTNRSRIFSLPRHQHSLADGQITEPFTFELASLKSTQKTRRGLSGCCFREFKQQNARGGVRLVPSPTWRPRGARRDAAQQRRGRGRGSPVVFFLTVKVLFEQARLCLAIGKYN